MPAYITEFRQHKNDFVVGDPHQPAAYCGPFPTEELAKAKLGIIGAKPGWFSAILNEDDHPGDYEGYTITVPDEEYSDSGRPIRAFDVVCLTVLTPDQLT